MARLELSKLLSAVACVLAFAAASPTSAQQRQLEMSVINTTPGISDLPLLAMQQIAPEYNMKLTSTEVQGGGAAGQVFVGGAGDVLLVGVDTPVGIVVKKLADLKIIGNVIKQTNWGLVVTSDSPITKLADLKGKSVGISGPGALSELTLMWGLKNGGLDPNKDVARIALGSQQSLQAGLENHKVDACMLTLPALPQVLADKSARLLGDWASHPYLGNVFTVRATDLAARRENFVRFYNLYTEALRRMRDPEFALKIARLRFPHNFTDGELKSQLAEHVARIWPSDGKATKDEYDSARTMWIAAGRLTADQVPAYDALVVDLSKAN